jgi:hypothetical protein
MGTSQRKGAKNEKETQELNENPENLVGQGLDISSPSVPGFFKHPCFSLRPLRSLRLCVEIQRRRQALSFTSTEPTPSIV